MRRTAVLAACGMALSACGGSTMTSYDLGAASVGATRGSLRGTLAIAEPQADASVDSDRIVIRTGPNELAYLSGAQWSERLPALVQSRLIETFENARMLKSVGRPGIMSDHTLALEIRRFEIDVVANVARIDIAARLVSDRSGRPVAAQVFTAESPAPTTARGAAAAALDAALAQVMPRIVAWTTRQI